MRKDNLGFSSGFHACKLIAYRNRAPPVLGEKRVLISRTSINSWKIKCHLAVSWEKTSPPQSFNLENLSITSCGHFLVANDVFLYWGC